MRILTTMYCGVAALSLLANAAAASHRFKTGYQQNITIDNTCYVTNNSDPGREYCIQKAPPEGSNVGNTDLSITCSNGDSVFIQGDGTTGNVWRTNVSIKCNIKTTKPGGQETLASFTAVPVHDDNNSIKASDLKQIDPDAQVCPSGTGQTSTTGTCICVTNTVNPYVTGISVGQWPVKSVAYKCMPFSSTTRGLYD